ncbi:MAG: FAD-dependent monooxygenase [Gammaproteobacteria bacterium]|nr:FAD-dependent monooxygenase [Gammaproteobacteria bacterium]
MSACDLAIAGAGPAGSTLALALSGLGLRIILIDPRAPGATPIGRRTLALSASSCKIFEALGLWPELLSSASPIEQIHVSEAGHSGMTRLRSGESSRGAFGYTLASDRLEIALQGRLSEAHGVEQLQARVSGFETSSGGVQLSLSGDGPATLQAERVVAADGSESTLRQLAGIPVQRYDYGQIAIAAEVVMGGPQSGIAYERFHREGPVALLPIVSGVGEARFGLVWTATPDEAERLLALPNAAFEAALNARFGGRFPGLKLTAGSRVSFPLSGLKAERLTAPGLLLVANAAQTLHPVAGQGLNLGLRDVAVLADLIAGAVRQGESPGSPTLGQAYEAARKRDRNRIAGSSRGLVQLFGAEPGPVVAGRNLGLHLMTLLPPLRHAFARYGMGLGRRVSRMERGLAP